MRNDVLPPPRPAACLWRPYSSNRQQKGGTLIFDEVLDVEAHERRLCDPDGYRPPSCPRCGHRSLHLHDYPERKVLAVKLVRYFCPRCEATWRMLPGFVAPKLWRSWPVVEAKTLNPRPTVAIPKRTRQRWRARLKTAAQPLIELLRQKADVVLPRLLSVADWLASRQQLVRAYAEDKAVNVGEQLAAVGALLHQVEPGVRLM
jgi:hypothetical protein